MIRRVLGLDISSTTIGICLLLLDGATKEITIEYLDHYKPTKEGSVLERLQKTRNDIANLIAKLEPTDIAIEDFLMYATRSNANTIILLATFNRMIGLLSLDYLGKPPALYPVLAIRRGLQRGSELPQKEEMPELVSDHLGIEFPWIVSKRGKKVDENFDRADGAAVGLFHALILANLLPAPKAKAKKPKLPKKLKAAITKAKRKSKPSKKSKPAKRKTKR